MSLLKISFNESSSSVQREAVASTQIFFFPAGVGYLGFCCFAWSTDNTLSVPSSQFGEGTLCVNAGFALVLFLL